MKDRLRLLIPALVLAVTAAACGGDGAEPGEGATAAPDAGTATEATGDGESVTLRFSCSCVPEDHHTKAIHTFAEEVEELSGGTVTVEVFDSGSLYDQTGEQTALLRGDLEMAYASSQWVSERVPEAGIVGVPYIINDVDHLYAVMDGEVGQELFDLTVSKSGIRPLTTIYLGTRQLNLTDVGRVETPEDLAGVKLRVPDAESWIKMGQALGANPTPVAFGELYLALQTGTVDGQDNPLPTTRTAKFYEVTDQIVLTAHLVNDVWPTINEEVWQSLSADQQSAIEQAWQVAREAATAEALQAEEDAAAFFEEEGLEVYEPDVDAFRDHVLPQYLEDEAITGQWVEGMLEKIQDQA
jgi:tripartite ATP-independent transporter DctP family solute receptor